MVFVFLFTLGAISGSIANWAIYQLGYFRTRPISPLGPRDPAASPRTLIDYLPIAGWLAMRRDRGVHGAGFWVRPLLIELSLAAGFPWFYHWICQGGLTGFQVLPAGSDAEIWFSGFALLTTLLVICTFIDFDEQTIPDWVTIPGTLAGLTLAAVAPGFRLPVLNQDLRGATYEALTFYSPFSISDCEWHRDWRGLAVGIAVVAIWIVALMPKIVAWRWGMGRGIRIMIASVLRPRRRTHAPHRIEQRRPFGITYLLTFLGMGLAAGISAVYLAGGPHWDSLCGALLGLAFGGGLVWAVRLIAGAAMGQEAMGFGDVTLMAMIGSFLGWQASLLVFALAPFGALAIATAQFLLTRNREIAFGPYLAFAAVVLIFGWSGIWNHWAEEGIFRLGSWLLAILGVSLIGLGALLLGMRALRGG